ncbi:hypothetical protein CAUPRSCDRAFT_13187, partial [Caulochytrium protostelioides]
MVTGTPKAKYVPESVLKSRKALEARAKAQAAAAEKAKVASAEKSKVIFKRAEQYVQEYRAQEQSEVAAHRAAKAANAFYVPAEPKLAFVVRLKGINKLAPKPRLEHRIFYRM